MKKKTIFSLLLMSLAVSSILGVCASKQVSAKTTYDAVVDENFTGNNGKKVNEIPTYRTVTAALSNAPNASKTKYVIYIKNGTYHEKITIDKPNISLLGEDKNKTKLSYDVASSTKKPDGTDYGTFDSASVSVIAPNFSAENLTIENTFDYLGNRAKANDDPTKLPNAQAVALKLDTGSNKVYIKNCNITGYQDTLFCNSGTQYFTKCSISGSIDFIFGAGQAFFNDCNIISLDMHSPSNNGYITAASTNIENKYGFVFYKCKIRREDNNMAKNSVALGRPWHPTTSFPGGIRKADPNAVGSVIYIDCFLDSHIKTTGWDKMSGKDENGNIIWFTPESSRFYEYDNKGPGAVINDSRKQLSQEDAQNCTEKSVLNGWQPK